MESDDKHRLITQATDYIDSLASCVRTTKSVDDAILIAEWAARFLTVNFCGVYRSDILEELILERLDAPGTAESTTPSSVLHIASELYSYGGHTRLLKAILSASPTENSDVLITRPTDASTVAGVLGVPANVIYNVRENQPSAQIAEIFKYCQRYAKIILHTHPDDIVCAVALRMLKRQGHSGLILLYNHSDHTFSTGIGVADKILEISTFGWALRHDRQSHDKSTFIGIPIATTPKIRSGNHSNTILSAGSAYKFKPRSKVGMPQIIRRLLEDIPTANAIIVGPQISNHWWWPVKLRFHGRLNVKRQLPYSTYLKQLGACSVYIDSFPITGGTAFTEALLSGSPVAGLKGDTLGYGAADSLRSENVGALSARVDALVRRDHQSILQQSEVRQFAAEFHSPLRISNFLRSLTAKTPNATPPSTFIADVPFRSFENSWRASGRICIPGFRNAAQARLTPKLWLANSKGQLGLRALTMMAAKAAYSILVRRK